MTFPASHSLDVVNSANHFVAFAYTRRFDSQYVLVDDIVMLCVRGDHFSDDITLFASVCDDLLSHVCAVNTEM